jgi:zinc transport system substrate-binding protein
MIYEAGLQPAVDAGVREVKPATVVEVSSVVTLGNTTSDSYGILDPHVWLDPMKMIQLGEAIAAQLIGIDPDNERVYTKGLASLTTILTSIDDQYQAGLTTCQRTTFLTTHAAFGYLADRYGLTQISISGLSPDHEPSPERITEIHRIAEEEGLTTVFFETLTSPELAKTIAEDLGLRTDVLDPIEGITTESRGSDYGGIMVSNLHALREANGCS